MKQNEVMAMVLPYKRKRGKTLYLVQRKNISAWDQHPDLCGIDFFGSEEKIEEVIIAQLNAQLNVSLRLEALKKLGLCGIERSSETLCHLYAIDMGVLELSVVEESNSEDLLTEHLTWVDEERILTSLDPQLIACYAKVHYLIV